MTLDQLKEILRAAADLTKETEFLVIGSAAILHILESPRNVLLSRSTEADLIVRSGDPDLANRISTAMGELSPFHDTHDVYAEGATFQTPIFAPEGWQDRTIRVHYQEIGVTAYFMEMHDLVLSKLGANRPKDLEFCTGIASTRYVNRDTLIERLAQVPSSPEHRERMKQWITRHFS